MKQILLVGGNFKNKGAEAMIATIYRELSAIPELKIIVASYAKENPQYNSEGKIILGQQVLDLTLIPNKKTIPQFSRICLAGITKSTKYLKNDPFLQALRESDCVIDVSGFAFSDKRSFLRRLMYCLEIFYAKQAQKPFIANSQAFGPFNKMSSKVLSKFFLPKIDLLIARGEGSKKYLEEIIPGKKIMLHPDVAYLFPAADQKTAEQILKYHSVDNSKPTFGIIPNINLYQKMGKEYIKLSASLADFIITELQATPVLICHEFYDHKFDDRKIIEEIVANVKNKTKVRIIDKPYSAAELKALISRFDFCLASRFHAIIASLSTSTPVVVIGWAHKYEELLRESGIPECLITYNNSSQFHNVIRERWQQREKIKKSIDLNVPRIKKEAAAGIKRIIEFIQQPATIP